MKQVFIYIIILFNLLANTTIFANEYHIEYLTSENGLSQNEVTSIIQDSNGLMWFGSRGGLNLYNGYDFIQYKPKVKQEHQLSNSSIECLFEDHNGNLWIGTKSGGINFYDQTKEQFSQITHYGKSNQRLSDKHILSIIESESGKILIGTGEDGIYVLDTKKDSVSYLMENSTVTKILIDTNNQAWVGTNAGFFKIDLGSLQVQQIDLGKYIFITDMIEDPDGEHIWIVGWGGGLTKFNNRTVSWKRFSLNETDKTYQSAQNSTYSLLLDSKDKLWIGTWGAGIYKFDEQKHSFTKVEIIPGFQKDYNTSFDVILDIFEDKDRNIWIGSDGGGIALIGDRKSFSGISLTDNYNCGLKSFHIKCCYETADGYLWIGTRGGGLYRTLDKKHFEYIHSEKEMGESLIVNYIWQIMPDKLWVSTGSDLYQLNISKNNLILTPFPDQKIFGIKKITAILKLNNDLLIGTQQNGLYSINNYFIGGKEIKNIIPQNDKTLKSARITFLKKDIDGKVWVGTFNGLYQFDNDSKSIQLPKFRKGEILTSEIINCLEETSDSIIWLGTPSGLNKLVKKENQYIITHLYQESGLPDDYIHAILFDNENHIWVSTNSGIVRINVNNDNITAFDKSDGLHGINFSEDQGYKSEKGLLYFGGVDGFTFFNPSEIELNDNVPSIVFTRFMISNNEIKPYQKINGRILFRNSIKTNPHIELTHKEKEIKIEFAAINYNATERNQYKYKMEGFDEDWVSVGTRHSAIYNNLVAGEYKFKVKGSNNNNVWNEEGTTLTIYIKPAPWKSWYAVLLYIFFIVGMALLIRWNAIKQVRLTNSLEMEKIHHEQEHQLNEMKLRFFTNISHEFRTPLTLILGPIKEILNENSDNKRVNVIYKNANRLMTLVNQLLEFRRVETDTLRLKASKNKIIDFVHEVCISFEELAKINNIHFFSELKLKTKEVWFDIEKMEIVLNNLISNAFKYAGSEANIQVVLSETDEFVCIHVIDDGLGIHDKDIEHIFERFYASDRISKLGSSGIGLNLVKRMVELHKGEISVESTPNIKTEFIIKLRKGESHFSELEKIQSPSIQTPTISKSGFLNQLLPVKDNAKHTEKNKSILIVDDNPEIRTYLKELFEKDFKIELAENGVVGYKYAIENGYDLIVSDVMMPEMDGLEMCRLLKSNIETSHIPIILLTAKSASQFKIEGLSNGAEAYISKPFNPEELKLQVVSILTSRDKLKKKFGKTITLEPTDMEINSQEEKFVTNILKNIEDNIENSDFNSEDLAKLAGMSTTTLYRKLKLLLGQSSNEIIRTLRLKRAAQLLQNSSNTISEIAYMVGFNDVKYFRKCFLKQFDKTPSEFRKSKTI